VRYWIYVYEDRSRKEEDIARTGPRGLKEGAVTRKSGGPLDPQVLVVEHNRMAKFLASVTINRGKEGAVKLAMDVNGDSVVVAAWGTWTIAFPQWIRAHE
jgi:hypothetical protein